MNKRLCLNVKPKAFRRWLKRAEQASLFALQVVGDEVHADLSAVSVHAHDDASNHVENKLRAAILKDYADVFPDDLHDLPPSRAVDHASVVRRHGETSRDVISGLASQSGMRYSASAAGGSTAQSSSVMKTQQWHVMHGEFGG